MAQQLGRPAHVVDVRNLADRDITRQWCPLHEAVWNDRGAIVRLLLEHGAKVDVVDAFGTTPLMMAVVKNNNALMKTLIADGKASLSAIDNDGRTPLHHAAARGTLDTIRLLLHVGASIETRDNVGHTAPDYAMISKRRRAYEVLRITRNEIDPADVLKFYFQSECADVVSEEMREAADAAAAAAAAAEEEKLVAGVQKRGRPRRVRAAEHAVVAPDEQPEDAEGADGSAASAAPASPPPFDPAAAATAEDPNTASDSSAKLAAALRPAAELAPAVVRDPDWVLWARRLKIRGSARRELLSVDRTERFRIVLNALIEEFELGGSRDNIDTFREEMGLPRMPIRIKVPRTVMAVTIDDFTAMHNGT